MITIHKIKEHSIPTNTFKLSLASLYNNYVFEFFENGKNNFHREMIRHMMIDPSFTASTEQMKAIYFVLQHSTQSVLEVEEEYEVIDGIMWLKDERYTWRALNPSGRGAFFSMKPTINEEKGRWESENLSGIPDFLNEQVHGVDWKTSLQARSKFTKNWEEHLGMNWWAIDPDGNCWFYEEQPELQRHFWHSDSYSLDKDYRPTREEVENWKTSLQSRPANV